MPLTCKGPRSGPFACQLTISPVACFYSATLAWNPTAVDILAERGRVGRQRTTKYGRCNHAETIMSCYKQLIALKPHARSWPGQQGKVALADLVLNRLIRTAKPLSIRR